MSKNKEKEKALSDVQKLKADSKKELKEFKRLHEFEIDEAVKDKDGNSTKVFSIDLDKEGYIGLYIKLGNPVSFSAKDGEAKEDADKLFNYLSFMSNINLSDTGNQSAVGLEAIAEARELVKGFFTLLLVSTLQLG